MNQNKKHITLTPDDIVKLLEQSTSNNETIRDFDGFEQAAMEGFQEHLTAEQARLLMNDIQFDISKKAVSPNVTDDNNQSKKNKIIWFSAAASLLLIIGLSFLFINNSHIANNESLALNETPLKHDVSKVNTPAENELETKSITKNGESGEGKLPKAKDEKLNANLTNNDTYRFEVKDSEQNTFKTNAASSANQSVNSITLSGLVTNQPITNFEKSAVDSKTESDMDIVTKNKKALTDEVASVPTSTTKESLGEYEAAKNLSKAKEEYKNDEADKKEVKTTQWTSAETISADRIDALAGYASTPMQNTTNAIRTNSTAYYTGGVLEIKNQVLAYHAKTHSEQYLQGSFVVKGTVLSNGSFVVKSITNLSKDYSNCYDFLKEALNAIKNWNAAVKNGKEMNSDIQFTLMF